MVSIGKKRYKEWEKGRQRESCDNGSDRLWIEKKRYEDKISRKEGGKKEDRNANLLGEWNLVIKNTKNH